MSNRFILIITSVFALFWGNLSSQNLVLNPSFETISGCPIGPGEFLRANNWNDVNSGADSCSSPDLIAGCAPQIGGVNSPNMLIGSQNSRTGANHAGIILYEGVALFGCTPITSSNYREYIEGQLSSPLVAGQTYCVSFYINLAGQAKWGVNSIGVFFSNGLYQHNFCTSGSPAPVTPQLQYVGPAIMDTTTWVRLQWNYTATGGETHFVIGNFRNDASTTRNDNACNSIHPYAYYFIDDVSVVAGVCATTCPTIVVTGNVSNVSCGSTNNGAVDISPSGGATPYTYSWSNGAISQDITGLSAGTYSVTVSDANSCTATFSATVTSVPGLAISPNSTAVSCFGGSNGVAAVNVSGGSGSYNYNWSNGATTAAISALAAGNYTVTVNSGSSGSTTDTLYRQDFSGVHNWTLNVNTGTNSATPQTWTVNAQEGGVLPPGCGVANNANNTLHITCTSLFCGTFITGAVYNATQQTNRRAESPVFSTVGYTGLTLRFNYISLGDGLLDNASVLYNDGSGWQVLNPSIKSPVCGSGQGQWTAFSATLPPSCNNNPNVRIGFNWTNNNDNAGTDPSIAVDNIIITSPGTGGSACSGVQTVTVTQPSVVAVANIQETCNTLNGTYVLEFDVSGGTGAYTVSGISGSFSGNRFTSIALTGAQSYTVTDANNCQVSLTASGTCSSSVSSCSFTNGCFNNNLVANSDFENYNPANPFQFFTSGFTPNNTNGTCTPGANCNGSFLCQGGFAISNSPTPCNPTWPSNIRDHTTGTGNMMLVDFPNTGSIPVWCQNVNLAPNTNYCFGAWFINLLPAGSNQGLPQFRYTINGISFDTTAFLQEDERWHFYGVQFNSGLGGPTDICILNQNTGFVGFDLAIDDISLRVITNGTLPQISNDTVRTCAGRAVSFNPTLNDAGAPGTVRILTPPAFTAGTATISGNNITFTPVAGFADTTTMEYELCVSGCCSSAVVTLIVNPNPNATLAISTNSICQGDSAALTAGPSGASYIWSLNSNQFLTASNNQISVANSGSYTVVVTDNNSCSATSNAVLLNNVSPIASLNGPAAFCAPSTGSYTASGGDFYTFSLNGAVVQNSSTNNTYNSTVLNDGDRLVVQVCRGLLYDGFINESVWSSPLATSAGGPAPGFGAGHEINAIYGGLSADSVYIAVAGNVQNNNRILVFIDSKTGGYSNGNFGRNAAPQGVDDFNSGSNFDAGFLPDYCMVIGTDVAQTNFFWDLYELSGTAGVGGGPNNFLGDLSSNRLHASPLNSSQTRGFESGISKAELGMTGNSFTMMAMYSSDAGFLSNQFMTPAGSGDGNYTNGVVDFAQAAPNPITVSNFLNTCCASDTIDVDISTPSLTVAASNVTCNGQSNGTATVSVAGGSNPISFLWSNGASTASVNGLNAGIFRVTVTANGCTASSAVTITQPSAITVSSISINASCFGSNGSINLTVSGGASPYSYAWSNGATTEDLTGLAVGSYTVNIRDASACNVQRTIVVNSNSGSTVTVDSVVNVTCNSGTNGAVNISAVSAPVPCSSPVIRINEILSDVSGGLAAGDGSGCGNATNPLSAEFIELIGPPGASIGCFVLTDGDWTITIPPGTTIPADGIFTIGNNNTPLHQGNGTVFDLNANACQCFTDSCQLLIFTNSGEYLAIFNSAGTFVDGLIYGTPSAANTPVAGTVIPTRGLVGCVNSVTLPPVASFTTTAQPAEGNTISRIPDGNGPYSSTPANTPNACNSTAPPVLTYQWSNGATTQDISGLAAGVYTVTVLDAQGCPTIRVVTVTQPSAVSISGASIASTCFAATNGSVNTTASGGIAPYQFNWSNASTTANQTGLAAGNYTLTVVDANNCNISQTFTITEPSAISVSTVPLDIACSSANIGGVNLTVSGGTAAYSFQWSNGETTQNISGLAAGNYSVTISDANNCQSFASATISSTPGLQVIATGTNLSCNAANDGCVQVLVNGGTAPYDYLWSNNSTLDSLCGLAPGTYTVIVTDNGITNCIGFDTIVITAPTALVSNTVSITNGNCSTPGAINIAVSGGTSPYSFIWSNGASTEDISGLAAGSYSVTITDANGCSIVNAANTVNSSGQPQLSVNNSANPTCNNSNDGTISITVTNGTTPYSFIWNSGQTTQNLSGLDGGNYTVTVTDALGCTASISASLTEPSAIQSTITTVPADCNNSNASIDVLASGGAGSPYSFVWQNAATTQNLSGLSSGNYAVTIEDANGCTQVENITVATPLIPQLSAFIGQSGIVDSSIVLGESIEVNAGNNQSSQGVIYQWTAVPGSANFVNDTSFATNVSPDPAGFYTMIITATSADGCVSTDTLTLTVNPASEPKIPNAFSPNNDGTNDIFRVVDLNVQYLKEFKVYNRWGKLVYDNLQGSWDGTFNGTEQPRETYIYIISWQLPSDPNPVLIRGTVTLLR